MANPMDWETGWGFMQKGIAQVKKIIEGETNDPIPNDFYMNLYSTSYLMSSQNPPHYYAKELYQEYKHTLDNYATAKVLPSILAKHDEFMLSEIVKRWSNHKVMVRWLGRFFHYLDRFYIPYRKLPTLREVGLTCFQDLVYEEIKGKAKDAILALINREREGEQIDRSLVKNAIDFFLEMGHDKMDFYENDLEGAIIDDAAACYRRLSSGWILEDSCPDYMRRVEHCLDAEKERVLSYMLFSTEPKLLEKLIHELLYVHTNQTLYKEHSGCRELLRKDMVGDLSRMFRLYSKVDKGLESVSKIFNEHVIAEGKALVEQAEEEASRQRGRGDVSQGFVRKVMELHDKYLPYVNDCFENHTLFHKALKEAFEVLCNKSVAGNSWAEILAAFSDGILQKGGSEKLRDGAVEEMLEKIVNLLAYIADKDLFFEFCWNKLARRLLYDRSANADNERSFLTKLKQEWGVQFTSKMEGMLTDLTLTRDNQASFDEYIRDNPHANPGIGLVVTVLTTGFWPNYKFTDLLLPAEMVKCVEAFREFYQAKTKQRRLMWIYSLGSCTITAKFESKTMELIVTTYQAATLLLFNTSDRLTCADITSQLNLMDDDVVRVLHSLSCAKYKILKKVPDTKSISPSDYFEVNSQFTDKMRRIRVPLPPTEERKNLIEHVNKDRKYAIDACLVRIMKSRKVLAYQQLVRECVELLSRTFKPDIKMIKNRIEDLISREYLKRDDVNPNTFKYVA